MDLSFHFFWQNTYTWNFFIICLNIWETQSDVIFYFSSLKVHFQQFSLGFYASMLAEFYKSLAYIQFSSGSDFLWSLLRSTLIIGIELIIINKRIDNFLRKQLPNVRLIQTEYFTWEKAQEEMLIFLVRKVPGNCLSSSHALQLWLHQTLHQVIISGDSHERVCMHSHVCLFAASWTGARQAPLSMGFPRQESWSGLPFPPPGGLPDHSIKPVSPVLADGFFTTLSHLGRLSWQMLLHSLN